ncbi:phage baseplate assembly protein V [Uliginosibacterium gangwonense]|uniref:phage baseplate assembly protein V n=1 Tax=Uliginosibacterium gangwonense TaxID=392736 RepID=UPI000366AC68|nr:phage baseplate assembly protein V [Uliginosibacterium gangwonense]
MDANTPNAEFSDLLRRFENLIRTGSVFAVQHANPPRVRVRSGAGASALETTWLPWVELRGGTTRTWNPPTKGEQVIVLCPSGDPALGVVIPALNSDGIPPPDDSPSTHVTEYPDGARVSYDHAAGHLDISGIKTLSIIASQKALFDVPETEFTGNVTIGGNLLVRGLAKIIGLLTYMAGLSGFGGGAGTVISGSVKQTGGNFVTDGDVIAGNISQRGHTHPEHGTGGGTTGGPQ